MRWIFGFAALTVVVGVLVKKIAEKWADYKILKQKPKLERHYEQQILIKEEEFACELKTLEDDQIAQLSISGESHRECLEKSLAAHHDKHLSDALAAIQKTVNLLDKLKERGHVTTREDARRSESGEFVRMTSDSTSSVPLSALAQCFQFLPYQEVVLNIGLVNRMWNMTTRLADCFRVLDFEPDTQLWKVGADKLVAISERFSDVTFITRLTKLSLIHISILSTVCTKVRSIADFTEKPNRNYISALQKLILSNENTLQILKFPEKPAFLKLINNLKIFWVPACVFETSLPFVPNVQALRIDESNWGSLQPSLVTAEQQNAIFTKFINLRFLHAPLVSRAVYHQLPISLTHLVVSVSLSHYNSEQTHATFGESEALALALRCPTLEYLHVRRIISQAIVVLNHLPNFKILKVDDWIDCKNLKLRPDFKIFFPPLDPVVVEVDEFGGVVLKQKKYQNLVSEFGVQFD